VAGAQVGADPFHSGAFAAGDQVVSGVMDIQLSNATGHGASRVFEGRNRGLTSDKVKLAAAGAGPGAGRRRPEGAAGPWRLSTLTHRVAVLSKVHQHLQLPNPADAAEVRQLRALARRAAHKRGERPTKKAAITRTELQALLATCGPDLAGVRDRALLYFGFTSGGRRRSEVAAATLAHLRTLPEGGFVYRLDQGKTLQDGPHAGGSPDKPLLGAAAAALQAWLAAAALTEGALFPRVWGDRVATAIERSR